MDLFWCRAELMFLLFCLQKMRTKDLYRFLRSKPINGFSDLQTVNVNIGD